MLFDQFLSPWVWRQQVPYLLVEVVYFNVCYYILAVSITKYCYSLVINLDLSMFCLHLYVPCVFTLKPCLSLDWICCTCFHSLPASILYHSDFQTSGYTIVIQCHLTNTWLLYSGSLPRKHLTAL